MSTIHHATFLPPCYHHSYYCTSPFLSLLFFIIVFIPMCHHYFCYWSLPILLLLHVTSIPIIVRCVVLVPTHCCHSYSSCCHYSITLPPFLFLHVEFLLFLLLFLCIAITLVLMHCHHSYYVLPLFMVIIATFCPYLSL